MKDIPLVTSSTAVTLDNFWNSVHIYHDRPHIVNKKVAAVSNSIFYKVSMNIDDDKAVGEFFTRESILYEFRKTSEITSKFLKNILEVYAKNLILVESNREEFDASTQDTFISVRYLLAHYKNNLKSIEVVIFDKKLLSVTFHAVQEPNEIQIAPNFPYKIQYSNNNNLVISVDYFKDAETNSAEWLSDKLFNKLLKWAENDRNKKQITSLSLIRPDEYCLLYSELKEKYAPDLIQVWPDNAKTNPEKYIFEDLGIAAYLICLWRVLDEKNVFFIDCGCGNGLLVYILHKYGYKGYGIDIRKRKIWDHFRDINLKVDTVLPTSVYPEATWLIGNHSDELTPWIPIISMKSSANFFLLPCCPYDFSGKKYTRSNTKLSQYKDYMNYVENIADKCGFEVKIDKLRIPSTKRTCLVGIKADKEVTFTEIPNQSAEFTPRDPKEIVRNCTQIDRILIDRVVRIVFNILLETENFINSWNSGGTSNISDLIDEIPAEDLKELKNNSGGLQTLLKNHRYIFEVKSGQVNLRTPPKLSDTQKYKEKPCWFHLNHPNGCLYTPNVCGYKHE